MYQTVVQLLGILASHSCTVCSLLNKVLNLEVSDTTGNDQRTESQEQKLFIICSCIIFPKHIFPYYEKWERAVV